jgi:hypothetical protein
VIIVEEEDSPFPSYSWDQDKESVFVTIPKVTKGLRGSDMDVKITRDYFKAGIKGQPPAVEGKLRYAIRLDESTWGLDTDDNKLEITLVKHIPQEVDYWPSLLVGGREIDVDLIEGSKYLDRSLLKKVKAQKAMNKESGGEGEASLPPLEDEKK